MKKTIFVLYLLIIPSAIALDDTQIKIKIDTLVNQMTIEEKVSLVHGDSLFSIASVERLGIPELIMSDGPHGVRPEQKSDDFGSAGRTDDASTYLPTLTALAATWNPQLALRFGSVLGSESRFRGKDIILGPGINIIRTPLCGRNFEYMSEDPYLISKMVVPYIKGVQQYDVAACVKHFALNNQENNRNNVDVYVSDRALNEIYLPGFKAAVQEAGVLTIMGSYNLFRGQHCCHNDFLLNQILKKQWGFKGAVISDWGGVYDTNEAAYNGLDIEMGTLNRQTNKRDSFFWLGEPFLAALKNGAIPESVLDEKVRRILYVIYKTNMFAGSNRRKGEFNTPAHQKTTLDIAREAIVLLKNDNALLPISGDVKTIAVIGENAKRTHAIEGGSSMIKALYEITPFEALQKKLNGKVQINFVQGYSSDKESPVQLLIEQAIEAAKKSDMVLIFGGLNHNFDDEGHDRPDMKLPYSQDELIKQVADANPKTVVVLISGSPVEVHQWISKVPSVIQGWYAGMEGGTAIADVLLGDVNPSGKLPFTFPVKLEDSPAHALGEYPGSNNKVNYNEDILVGYRYYDTKNAAPQFCFGHGLSYTDFEYSNLKLSSEQIKRGEKIIASVDVKNTGKIEGADVVQLYISDTDCSVLRPSKELKDFSKVFLKPGEKKNVKFEIDAGKLAFYSESEKNWITEAGEFKILIGSSSCDIRLEKSFQFN